MHTEFWSEYLKGRGYLLYVDVQVDGDNINMNIKEVVCDVCWIKATYCRGQWRMFVSTAMDLRVRVFLD